VLRAGSHKTRSSSKFLCASAGRLKGVRPTTAPHRYWLNADPEDPAAFKRKSKAVRGHAASSLHEQGIH